MPKLESGHMCVELTEQKGLRKFLVIRIFLVILLFEHYGVYLLNSKFVFPFGYILNVWVITKGLSVKWQHVNRLS